MFPLQYLVVFTFLADNFLRLWLARDRHDLHQQTIASLPDQGYYLLVADLHHVHTVHLMGATHVIVAAILIQYELN